MKNLIAFIAMLFFVLLLHASNAAALAGDGGILHKNILSRYPTIDISYYQPTLTDGLSSSPMVQIDIPAGEWERLTAEQKKCLEEYASLATSFARNSPLKYSGVDPSTPIASKIKYNARYITADSWIIYSGPLINRGRDILADKIIAQGQ